MSWDIYEGDVLHCSGSAVVRDAQLHVRVDREMSEIDMGIMMSKIRGAMILDGNVMSSEENSNEH
jgi:hypothetical protein